MTRNLLAILTVLSGVMLCSTMAHADSAEFRTGEDGKQYWYENGVKQGTYDDVLGILGDGTNRGREIYDPASNGWYWLDSCYDGAKAVNKEVWVPYVYQDELVMSDTGVGRVAGGISSIEAISEFASCSESGGTTLGNFVYDSISSQSGKWVRYDADGKMIKGWLPITGEYAVLYPEQAGNTYYYDMQTGAMVRNCTVAIDGYLYSFDQHGVLCAEAKYATLNQAESMTDEETLEWAVVLTPGKSFVTHQGHTVTKNEDGSVTETYRTNLAFVPVPATTNRTFSEKSLTCEHPDMDSMSNPVTVVYDSVTCPNGDEVKWPIGEVYRSGQRCEVCGYTSHTESDLMEYSPEYVEERKNSAISTYEATHFRRVTFADGREFMASAIFCDREGNETYYLSDGTTYVEPAGAYVIGEPPYDTPDGLPTYQAPIPIGTIPCMGYYEYFYNQSVTYYALDGSIHYWHLVDDDFVDEVVEEFPEEVPEEFKAMNGCWNK